MILMGLIQDQKKKELNWLQAFRDKCRFCPSSHFRQPNPPAPDILFPDCALGIEITEYSLRQGKDGSLARQFEVVHQRIAQDARHKFEGLRPLNLQVSLLWTNFRACPTSREEDAISTAVAQHVVTNTTTRQGNHFVDWGPPRHHLLQKYGLEANIRLMPESVPSHWSSVACFSFPKEAERIQAVLAGKEPRVPTYRKTCRELWLLIIAGGEFFSSQFPRNPNFSESRFYSSFNRVFVLDQTCNVVHEISVEKPAKSVA